MDIKHIKNLIALMVENDLSQIEIEEGETHILLKRGQPPVVSHAPAPVSAAPAAGNPGALAAPPPASGAAAPASEPKSVDSSKLHIASPMVGTFYSGPDPESPPFVNVGDVVEPDTVVCLVEAMKVFNEIKAELSGRLTRVLVNNAEAVEYDQPLFEVAPL
jgi:acetyl-CoA carboxylase biotin carboxyl carrier protein